MADSSAATTIAAKATNVQVAVRCRPLNQDERRSGQPTVIACHPETKTVNASYGPPGKKITKSFTYDKVFGMYSTQEEVFSTVVRPIVDEALAGFNCTIFAYGQTGTGKTHTMEGDIHSEEHAGIVPRSVKYILEQLENSEAEYTIRVSFLELYNEELQDLLNSSKEKKLKLCEDGVKGVVCQNLEEITVLGASDIFEIMQRGIQNRQTAETLCNKNSSRSHSIFTLKIMIKECNVDGEEVVRHGQLNLVDLAGSECVGRSGAKNDRAREAGNINQSLLTLGRVITALVDHHSHVPYRDSKLTRILQESLGGKAKTCIIATLSPSQSAVEETLSTLDYAYRAKSIKNQPTVNQKMTKKVVLKEYCAEIEQLRTQLQLTREKNGVYMDPTQYYAMEAKMASQESQLVECEAALKVRSDEIKGLKFERDEMVTELDALRKDHEETVDRLCAMEQKLLDTEKKLKYTQNELQASEAVVNEMSKTESSLHGQGQRLQDEISDRRRDIRKLLDKIDGFSELENLRLNSTQDHVKSVHECQSEVLVTIDRVILSNATKNDQLTSGVNEILSKSRTTCDDLKRDIADFLSKLLSDSQDSCNEMIRSCDGVNRSLRGSESDLVSYLTNVEKELEKCFESFEALSETLSKTLEHQKIDIAALSTSLAGYNQSMDMLLKGHIDQQDSMAQSLVSKMDDLKKDLASNAAANLKSLRAAAVNSELTLAKKVSDIRDQVGQMLDDIIKTGSSSASSMTSQMESMEKELNDKCSSHHSAIVNELSRQSDDRTHFSSKFSDIQSDFSAKHQDLSGKLVHATDAEIDVNNSVKELIKNHVETSIVGVKYEQKEMPKKFSAMSQSVVRTSEAANTMLTCVQSGAKAIDEQSKKSINQFTDYVNKHGDKLATELRQHLLDASEAVAQVKPKVIVVDELAAKFGEDIESSKMVGDGSTPTKQSLARCLGNPFDPLAASRPQHVIRREVLDRLNLSDGIVGEAFTFDSLYPSNADVRDTKSVSSSDVDSLSRVSTSSMSSNSSDGSKKRKVDQAIPDDSSPSGDEVQENDDPNVVQMAPLKSERSTKVARTTRLKDSSVHSNAGSAKTRARNV